MSDSRAGQGTDEISLEHCVVWKVKKCFKGWGSQLEGAAGGQIWDNLSIKINYSNQSVTHWVK
jgi:hypothetical protein